MFNNFLLLFEIYDFNVIQAWFTAMVSFDAKLEFYPLVIKVLQ